MRSTDVEQDYDILQELVGLADASQSHQKLDLDIMNSMNFTH